MKMKGGPSCCVVVMLPSKSWLVWSGCGRSDVRVTVGSGVVLLVVGGGCVPGQAVLLWTSVPGFFPSLGSCGVGCGYGIRGYQFWLPKNWCRQDFTVVSLSSCFSIRFRTLGAKLCSVFSVSLCQVKAAYEAGALPNKKILIIIL
jgi:hypothetical protein